MMLTNLEPEFSTLKSGLYYSSVRRAKTQRFINDESRKEDIKLILRNWMRSWEKWHKESRQWARREPEAWKVLKEWR